MGWTLNGVQFQRNGTLTRVYADGNNIAWVCPRCGCPILFVYQNGRIGSHPDTPSHCRGPGCDAAYSLSPAYGFQPEPPKGDMVIPAPFMTIV
jgi:hypothetical protein